MTAITTIKKNTMTAITTSKTEHNDSNINN